MLPQLSGSTHDFCDSLMTCKQCRSVLHLSDKKASIARCVLSNVPPILPWTAPASFCRHPRLTLEPNWLEAWMSALLGGTEDIAVFPYGPSVSECRFYRSYVCNSVWRGYRKPHSTQDTVGPPEWKNILETSVLNLQIQKSFSGVSKTCKLKVKCSATGIDRFDLIFKLSKSDSSKTSEMSLCYSEEEVYFLG